MHGSDEERSVTLFDDDVDHMYRKISTSKNPKKKKKVGLFSFDVTLKFCV
ncbi:hypothetical protein MUK42_32890 [Musa troglodytarum]|uniref:Uncharacterized protein n=1 Tax=Musa troglodytarum TaxID=320322 RepID=A0A9E7LFF2_9LILI|nr:hypothetical protein MUK42_32890 [Musa troglodytarum]